MSSTGAGTAPGMRFGLRSSQHHKTWAQLKDNFTAADEWGLESAWVFDHMIPLSDPRTGPNLDGWTLLAGLAQATTRVLIGPMVTGITYRNPALLLKIITTVDHISNGRALMGVGAAWFEGEHHMFGFDYPSDGDRVTMLNEALEAFKLLQEQPLTTYEGKFVTLKEAIFEPKPIAQQNGTPHLPVVIGGSKPRMLRLIARHADWWDNNFGNDDEYRERVKLMEEACAKIGRDPLSIRRSTTLPATFTTSGDAAAQRNRMEELRALGITDILFAVPDDVQTMRPFVEDVLPDLRDAWSQ